MIHIKLIILFLFPIVLCYSQDREQSDKLDIPSLLYSDYKRDIIIKDTVVTDSLKIFFQVVVNFKYPLKDTTKCIIVDKIHILRMSVISLNNKEQIINFTYNNERGSPYQKYIWDLCNNKFNYWYRKQSYKMMKNKSEWGNRIVFAGTLYINK